MSIFRRAESRQPAAPVLPPRDDVLPRPQLSRPPHPDPPQGSMSGPVRPEFDPCGAPAIGTRKGRKP